MDIHLILDLSTNPEYFRLVEEQVALMGRFNALYREVDAYQVSRLWPWTRTFELKGLGQRLHDLLTDWLSWQNRACNFALSPQLRSLQPEFVALTTSHIVSNLWFIIVRTRLAMESLRLDHNSIWAQRANQVNFNIATISFIVTLFGLIATLYALTQSG
jgi:hypothetical protein